MFVASESFATEMRRGSGVPRSLVFALLTLSACGGRSDLGAADAYVLDATSVAVRDSGSSEVGDTGLTDDGLLPGDGGAGNVVAAVPELADCLPSPYELHVVATDYNGTTGAFSVSGSKAAWPARTVQDVTVDLLMGPRWIFAMGSDFLHDKTLRPGTYRSVPRPGEGFVQVMFEGVLCPGTVPTGTFTIVDYAIGDPAFFPKMLVWFDLRCGEGKLRGCVRYGE
jgi:hypothetical protein